MPLSAELMIRVDLLIFVPCTQLVQRSNGSQLNIQWNVGEGKLMMTPANAEGYIVLKRNVICLSLISKLRQPEGFSYEQWLVVEKSFHPRCRHCLAHRLCSRLWIFLTDRVLFQSRILDHDLAFKPTYSMMWRLRASRDEFLLFMGIRIRSLPPRKPTDPTDLESTQYLSPFKLKIVHLSLPECSEA